MWVTWPRSQATHGTIEARPIMDRPAQFTIDRPFNGAGLQIQCYQCEEAAHDCSLPDYVVNCTVNVQDTCQQEVLVTADGVHYRKSCASSGACLISSSGYQQFCTGRLHSVCISCCSQPLCNGPSPPPAAAPPPASGAPPPSAGSSHSSCS
ncbi:unnamed protein product [Boreogadus saida]